MKRLATICARGGSKGVKNKNLKMINGHPLIAYTILHAKESKAFDAVAVSSDSEEILKAAEQYGVKILIKRPPELATDAAAKLPVIIHCMQEAEKASGMVFDIIADLDCTAPLRTKEDISNCLKALEASPWTNLVSGGRSRKSPYFNLVEQNPNGSVSLSKIPNPPLVRRQDAPICYDLNGSIYAWKRDCLMHSKVVMLPSTSIFEMPDERSWDIDSELDFQIVSMLLTRREDFKF